MEVVFWSASDFRHHCRWQYTKANCEGQSKGIHRRTFEVWDSVHCSTLFTFLSLHPPFQNTYKQGECISSQLNIWLRGQRRVSGSVLGTLKELSSHISFFQEIFFFFYRWKVESHQTKFPICHSLHLSQFNVEVDVCVTQQAWICHGCFGTNIKQMYWKHLKVMENKWLVSIYQ